MIRRRGEARARQRLEKKGGGPENNPGGSETGRGWQLSLLGGGERGTIHERHVEPLNTCERIPFGGKSELNVTLN